MIKKGFKICNNYKRKPNIQNKNNNNYLYSQKYYDIKGGYYKEESSCDNNDNESKHILKNYFFFYFFCILLSIVIKILLDIWFIDEYSYSSRKKVNIYLISSYLIAVFFSLCLYLYLKDVLKSVEKEKAKQIYSIKLCGYLIYIENIPNDKVCCYKDCKASSLQKCCECLEDCSICCKTLNLSCCCYLCSCTCCCKTICCCQCRKYDEINKDNILRENKDINKLEAICVCYRITGRWNWLGKILTDIKIFPLALILYIIHFTNMGFEDRIWDNLKKHDKKDFFMNFIILSTIFVYYFINSFGSKFLVRFFDLLSNKKADYFQNKYKFFPKEFKDIFLGYIPYIMLQTICSIILSIIIKFDSKEIHRFVLSIPLGSIEYIKINILEIISFFYEISKKDFEFFSSSTIFSFYLLIYNFILALFEVLDIKNDTIILIQFIIGNIVEAFIFIIFIYMIIKFFSCKGFKDDMHNILTNYSQSHNSEIIDVEISNMKNY